MASPFINPAEYRHRGEVQRRDDSTLDTGGNVVVTWNAVGTRWFKRRFRSGIERLPDGTQVHSEHSYELRTVSDTLTRSIISKDRVVIENDTYEIIDAWETQKGNQDEIVLDVKVIDKKRFKEI